MLTINNISFAYSKKKTVLENINFTLKKGEHLCIMGESGCGKSTLLKIIYGLLDLPKGEIFWDKEPILGPEFNLVPGFKNFKYVAQDFDLMPYISVSENIKKFLSRFYPEESEKRTQELLNVIEMKAFEHVKVKNLSGGQKQRVAIARALVYEPEILLMDEPLGALDKKLREELQDELRLLHKRLGITIVYVTHDQDEAMRLSERIAIFKEGEIVGLGTGKDLYRKPPNAFVASFLGNSNFLKVSVTGSTSAMLNKQHIEVENVHEVPIDQKAVLMIRPENLHILTPEQAEKEPLMAGFNQLSGTVNESVFLGESLTCSITIPSGEKVVSKNIATEQPDLAPGSTVFIRWNSKLSSLYSKWEQSDINKNAA